MKLIIIIKYSFVSLILLVLIGCRNENASLEDFKKSPAAQEVRQCVGANGSIEWKIFTSSNYNNPDVRIIEAKL